MRHKPASGSTRLRVLAVGYALIAAVTPAATAAESILPSRSAGPDARVTVATPAVPGVGDVAFTLGARAYASAAGAASHETAMYWWRVAAAAGTVEAQYNLGLLLAQDGEFAAAEPYLRAAADRQHVLACYVLGTLLAEHQAPDAAARLQCAARAGYAPAQYNLARVYARDGHDFARARLWYQASAVTFAPALTALAALPSEVLAAGAVPRPDAAPLVVHDQHWVMQQPAAYYTVQVATANTSAALERWLETTLADGDAAWFRGSSKAREPYCAIVGVFAERATAARAAAALPAPLRVNSPWIRRFADLQQELEQRGEGAVETASRVRAGAD